MQYNFKIIFTPARDRHFTGNQYCFIIFILCLFMYINLDNNYNNTIRLFYGAILSLDVAKLISHLACLWWTIELLRESEKERERVPAEVDLLLPLLMYRPIQLGFTSRLWCSSCFRLSIPSTRAHTHRETHTRAQCHSAASHTLRAPSAFTRPTSADIPTHRIKPSMEAALLARRGELF